MTFQIDYQHFFEKSDLEKLGNNHCLLPMSILFNVKTPFVRNQLQSIPADRIVRGRNPLQSIANQSVQCVIDSARSAFSTGCDSLPETVPVQ